ncbi:MAG: hypothetical protein JSS19_10325 [Proteobacteria bacterium]|nr:hypothetical protein [Pseudomonadota bacterium]
MNRLLLGYDPDFDLFADARLRAATSRGREPLALANDRTEAATELLEAVGCPMLPTALRRLLRSAARAAGGSIDGPLEVELIRLLQHAACIALPAPRTLAARNVAARAGRFFGIELEGLSPEDQEFESARHFIELVRATAAHAVHAPSHVQPAAAARLAVSRAAKRFAPGWSAVLLRPIVTAGRSRPHLVQGAHHA